MPNYSLNKTALSVQGDLLNDEAAEFQGWCRRLVESAEPKVVIDLSEVPRIHSSCIGVLATIWVDLLNQNRTMDLIVSSGVRKTLTMAGFHMIFKLQDS